MPGCERWWGTRSRALAATAMLGLALLGTPAAAARPAADTLTVVSLNLWHDQSNWPRRMAKIVAGLRALRPDVLCLQEVLEHERLPNQALALAESLGCRAHFVSVDPAGGPKRYGNAILSRHRMLVTGGRFLDPRHDYRVVAHVRLEVRGRAVDVYDTHLHHTPEGGAIRAEQVRDLLAFVDSTRGRGALLLAGDFNAELGSAELAPLERGYADAYAVTHPGPPGPEAATMNPRFSPGERAIDHVFVPRGKRPALTPLSAEILFRDPGPDSVWASDHFGVLAKLGWVPAR